MGYKTILAFARHMRKNPTLAENYFWHKVRDRSFHGYKFYWQYIIESGSFNNDKSFFITDFYCHNRKVYRLDKQYRLVKQYSPISAIASLNYLFDTNGIYHCRFLKYWHILKITLVLVIEIDGDIHLQQIECDNLRENNLIEMGYKIIRFKNEDVLTKWNVVEELLLKEIS